MDLESIQAVSALQPNAAAGGVTAPLQNLTSMPSLGNEPASFGDLVSQGLQQVNSQLNASQLALQRLATGDVQNLHQVMIGLEESRLSFQLFMQVRNRMLEAYQDIMKMQV
jgi:flagellar hook-basal body complex protein FliE